MFNAFISMLRARYDFDLGRVLDFQFCVDNFMDLWHKLTGRDGIGNYFHLLDVGHVADQLLMHGNLYKYLQQGWEAVNKKAKKIFLTKTAMGGGTGGFGKLLTILLLFLREMF